MPSASGERRSVVLGGCHERVEFFVVEGETGGRGEGQPFNGAETGTEDNREPGGERSWRLEARLTARRQNTKGVSDCGAGPIKPTHNRCPPSR